jgi:hypothetical protein
MEVVPPGDEKRNLLPLKALATKHSSLAGRLWRGLYGRERETVKYNTSVDLDERRRNAVAGSRIGFPVIDRGWVGGSHQAALS